jgi:micrococcal nuclease
LNRLAPIAVGLALILGGCSATIAPAANNQGERSQSPSASHVAHRSSPQPTSRPTARPRQTPRQAPEPVFGRAPTGPTQRADVTRVIDGDTIEVSIGGLSYRVRYIGIDTPETVRPGTPIEWMGPEASATNHRLVDGAHVVLEKDVSETDRYGRLLRYVWLHPSDGTWRLVNLALVRLGFASVSTYPPDVKYTDALFVPAQRAARADGLGLWGTPPSTPAPEPSQESGGNCDPSYPGVCIPPYPPDLDCGDLGFTDFAVVPPDLHGFDGDGDGVGCET